MTKKNLIEYIWPFYVKNVSWLYALSILPPKPLPRNPLGILPFHAISWFCKEPTESHLALPAGMLTNLADLSCVGHHNSCEFKSVMSVPCHEDGCSQHSATSSTLTLSTTLFHILHLSHLLCLSTLLQCSLSFMGVRQIQVSYVGLCDWISKEPYA